MFENGSATEARDGEKKYKRHKWHWINKLTTKVVRFIVTLCDDPKREVVTLFESLKDVDIHIYKHFVIEVQHQTNQTNKIFEKEKNQRTWLSIHTNANKPILFIQSREEEEKKLLRFEKGPKNGDMLYI